MLEILTTSLQGIQNAQNRMLMASQQISAQFLNAASASRIQGVNESSDSNETSNEENSDSETSSEEARSGLQLDYTLDDVTGSFENAALNLITARAAYKANVAALHSSEDTFHDLLDIMDDEKKQRKHA